MGQYPLQWDASYGSIHISRKGAPYIVYVQSKTGQPLMPTNDHCAVRQLLKQHKATVVKRTPFTIRLNVTTHVYTQPATLGVDAGSKTIGLSASTPCQELFASEVQLRTDIVEKLATRREMRRHRRYRKARYRKARFKNRVHSKKRGWLAPSIRQKIGTHLRVVADVHKILPISRIIVETAAFDIQKIREPGISSTDYQYGEQRDFWNVREYVLWRDGHTCQCCHGKSKDVILNVHHIESRKVGGDAPNNLITLCETCHKAYHQGKVKLNLKRGASFRDAAFMGIMRWAFYDQLKALYPYASMTYGYITKNVRISHGLPKGHAVDALCIAGHPDAKRADTFYLQKVVRRHNRQLHKMTIGKGGKRKLNQSPRFVFGFQLFDKVKYQGKELFIFGRRLGGRFLLRSLDGAVKLDGISYKKFKLLEGRRTLLIDAKRGFYP